MRAEESLEQAEAIVKTIDDKSRQMMTLENDLYLANKTLDEYKHELMGHVSAEQTSDGKKKYTNAETRRAEVENRAKGKGASVATLLKNREDIEYYLKQAERHLKFHYKVIDWEVSKNLSLMPSVVDIQEFLFQTVKQNVAELLMVKTNPKGGPSDEEMVEKIWGKNDGS